MITTSVEMIVKALIRGDIVGLPTETVYGLAGNAKSEETVLKIFSTKERPLFDPLIVHIPESWDLLKLEKEKLIDLSSFSKPSFELTKKLIQKFWPGPLTLIFPRGADIPDLVTSGLQTVALRSPRHRLFQDVLKLSGLVLAAPSANRFGKISPTDAQAVESEFKKKSLLILDGGTCEIGIESTVIQVDPKLQKIFVYRPGGVSLEELKQYAETQIPDRQNFDISPGLLPSHYSPHAPLRLFQNQEDLIGEFLKLSDADKKLTALLFYSSPKTNFFNQIKDLTYLTYKTLSDKAAPPEAVRVFFKYLRDLDQTKPKAIWAELPPSQEGLLYALTDRLIRAAANPES